jgi:hypothetical protein
MDAESNCAGWTGIGQQSWGEVTDFPIMFVWGYRKTATVIFG